MMRWHHHAVPHAMVSCGGRPHGGQSSLSRHCGCSEPPRSIVVSQNRLSLEEASVSALACSGVSDFSSASRFPEKLLAALSLGDELAAGQRGFAGADWSEGVIRRLRCCGVGSSPMGPPHCGKPWPGSEASPAMPTTRWTPRSSHCHSRWGLGILSYRTVAPQAYAAASEAADTTLAPILTAESLPASTQLITQHQRCQEIFEGNKEALLGSLTAEQAKAVVEASSKLGRVWLTTIPFEPSLRLTHFEVPAALHLPSLAGEREAHCTNCGEATSLGTPRSAFRGKHGVWPARRSQAHHWTVPLAPPPVPESDSNPSATRPADATTSRLLRCLGPRPPVLSTSSMVSQLSLWQTRMPLPQTSRIRTPTLPGWSAVP
jgi:hypothetical protein